MRACCPSRADSYTLNHDLPADAYKLASEHDLSLCCGSSPGNRGLQLHDHIVRDDVSAVESMLRKGVDANEVDSTDSLLYAIKSLGIFYDLSPGVRGRYKFPANIKILFTASHSEAPYKFILSPLLF